MNNNLNPSEEDIQNYWKAKAEKELAMPWSSNSDEEIKNILPNIKDAAAKDSIFTRMKDRFAELCCKVNSKKKG